MARVHYETFAECDTNSQHVERTDADEVYVVQRPAIVSRRCHTRSYKGTDQRSGSVHGVNK